MIVTRSTHAPTPAERLNDWPLGDYRMLRQAEADAEAAEAPQRGERGNDDFDTAEAAALAFDLPLPDPDDYL